MLLALSLLCAPLAAQGLAPESGPSFLRLVERSDFSRYLDGAYLGHAYREGRLALEARPGGGYAGEYFLLEETLRDLRSEARRLDRSGPVELKLGEAGALEGALGLALPALRGVPAPPPEALAPGLSWIGAGSYLLELRGELLVFPLLAEYRAVGALDYAGRKAYRLTAKFALRSRGLGPLREASGSHDLELYLDAASGLPFLIRDRFDETYAFSDGGRERRAGFRLLFYEGSGFPDRLALVAKLGAAAGPARGAEAGGAAVGGPAGGGEAGGAVAGGAETGLRAAGPGPIASEGELPLAESPEFREASARLGPGFELEPAASGLLLRVLDLRFLPDSAEPLPEEAGRLDLLARALLAAEGRSFLVEGHSAAVGRSEGELELSLLRARRVVEELVARGLAASRFVYRGLGSSRPLASNASEEGRARNRRVEITILD